MRSLNRLKWLHAFEAAARHGSFTGAARELGVTPAAVGQLVRALEEWVGHPLLHRTRAGKARLTLVSEAQEALQDITQGLDKLESGLNKLRGRRARSVVVITASQVLMMNWLMERLNRFSAAHENIDLRLNVTEKLMDVAHGEADLGIRCGRGDWLAAQKLIHDDTPHPGASFPSWEDVLAAAQAPTARDSGMHIDSTSAVILAALSGRGVALVRRALVKQHFATGQLVQLQPARRWPLTWSYYIVTPQHAVMRPEVTVFYDWLLNDVLAENPMR